MKTNLIIFAILLIAITGCKDNMNTEPIKGTHTLGTEAKNPFIYYNLTTRLWNSATQPHENCLLTDNGVGKGIFYDLIDGYLVLLADEIDHDSEVVITYVPRCLNNPAEMDYVEVTYNTVKHTFYQNYTTDWDGSTIPTAPIQAPAQDQMSPTGSPSK